MCLMGGWGRGEWGWMGKVRLHRGAVDVVPTWNIGTRG